MLACPTHGVDRSSGFICPACGGAIWTAEIGSLPRFRCHTGHAYTADSLLADLNNAKEQAIWNSIRCVQENAMLLMHLAEHWRPLDAAAADRFSQMAKKDLARAETLRSAAGSNAET